MERDKLLAAASQRPLNQEELLALNESLPGLDKTLGIRYTHIGPDKVRTALRVGPHLLQLVGLVNGGVYCAIGESAASVAAMVNTGGPVVGVNNSTDLISSVRTGVIEAETSVLQSGRRTQITVVDMTHEGKLVARTTLRTMSVG